MNHTINNVKYVIAGSGFYGLAVLYEMLSSGINLSDIILVDRFDHLSYKKESRLKDYSLLGVAKRESKQKGIGKSGARLNKSGEKIPKGYIWGLSCFPYSQEEVMELGINWSTYLENYQKLEKLFEVQSPCLERSRINTYTPRKKLTYELDGKYGFQHSQLALSSEGVEACTLNSGCFDFCEVNSPITPRKILKKIESEFGKVKIVVGEVQNIDTQNRILTLPNLNVEFEKLFVCLGVENTSALMGKIFSENFSYSYSPVTLIPYLAKKKSDARDYYNHFSYADLISKNENYFLQMYLPSIEISGRILSVTRLDKFEFLKKLHTFAEKSIFRRLGIAMVFHNEEINIAKASSRLKSKEIRSQLKSAGFKPFFIFSRQLDPGSSNHYGNLEISKSKISQFNFDYNDYLREKSIYIADNSLLPKLMAGPITLPCAAYIITRLQSESSI